MSFYTREKPKTLQVLEANWSVMHELFIIVMVDTTAAPALYIVFLLLV